MSDVRLHAALTLTNAETGDTESFFLDTLTGETQRELYDSLTATLRRFADDWEEFIRGQV